MKLYLISQDLFDEYDTYDSAVVAAESEDDARTIHPYGKELEEVSRWKDWPGKDKIDEIKVEYLGETTQKRGVICASFNAG